MAIEPFYIEKLTDAFLAIGVKSFLDPKSTSADLVIERVYSCDKYSATCIIHDRDLKLILAEEDDGDESPDYPIGSMLEPYDIERDKQLCD